MTTAPGYFYHPSKYATPLGSSQLDITLLSNPADRFFDTVKAEFPVVVGDAVKHFQVTHPWREQSSTRICAGHFSLFSRDGAEINGFSFGGMLIVTSQTESTTATLSSSAPIFDLRDDPETIGKLLIAEIELLFAKRRAELGRDEGQHFARLAKIDPLLLCVVCINTIKQRIQQMPSAVHYRRFRDVEALVNRFVSVLTDAGQWTATIPALDEVL